MTSDQGGKEEETYPMDAYCQNCGNSERVNILKGKTAAIFRENYLCPVCNCGCITIKPIMRFG